MITYTISMPAPHTHLFHVTIEVDRLDRAFVDLILPSWTPGSYMIREYARHVQGFGAFAAVTDAPLPWRKIAKDAWRVETGGAERVQVRYQVYANDLTVRTSHLDGAHGYFNGASVFMFVPGREAEPLRLRVAAPPGWQVTTGLDPADRPNEFLAADYDELVDCPVECGAHRLLAFEVDDVPHRIAIWGCGNEDEARLIADTRRIVEAQRDFFGALPYRHYTFILHLLDGRGGGLEHRNSVTNQVDRWTFRPERNYERYLSLTSHELFHVWNAKRLRPAPLGPFDYRRENYTRLLWLVEGATSYYDNLLLVRAGLMTPERFLERLGEAIAQLQNQPGRFLQSLEQSSFDAWIKFYRPDENSANSSVSYYLKGGLVCFLLDMEIRARTGGRCSLDDLMRQLYATYPISGPGIPEDGALLAAVEELTGDRQGAFRDFFARYVSGVEELDYARALAVAGLEVRWERKGPRAWLGCNLKRQGERTIIESVRSDGPAWTAGVYAGDELLALDGWRVNDERLTERLEERQPGDSVRLTLFRGDALIEAPVTLAEAPPDRAVIAPLVALDDAQRRTYRSWLGVGLLG
ncbi:MAG: PDZ domain-containing protein [Chloroflexaceae bacterium]|nr:PDZ domain-containing protein [Chloroflexaceae bacterium]